MKITCRYTLLVGNKNILPLFIQFAPDNKIILKLDKEIVENSDKFKKIIELLSTWFTDITLLRIEE